jgi:hypothetical protein
MRNCTHCEISSLSPPENKEEGWGGVVLIVVVVQVTSGNERVSVCE